MVCPSGQMLTVQPCPACWCSPRLGLEDCACSCRCRSRSSALAQPRAMARMGRIVVPRRTASVSGWPALVHDLEILDAQSLHFELLDNEMLDRRAVDRQAADRQRPDRGGSYG